MHTETAQITLGESVSKRSRNNPSLDPDLPQVNAWMLKWFTKYSTRYLKKHFHALRLSCSGTPPDLHEETSVIYLNHSSWWDPLVCLFLSQQFFPKHHSYAPISAKALEKYKMLGRIGLFGIDQHSHLGAARFLRTSEKILTSPRSLLWLTPQGRFVDSRERPLKFQAGLGHLAARKSALKFIPLALDFSFWEERSPEILCRFGTTIRADDSTLHDFTRVSWTALLEKKLAETQDALALESQRRDLSGFQILFRGSRGVNWFYDRWRRCQAAMRGEKLKLEHGAK